MIAAAGVSRYVTTPPGSADMEKGRRRQGRTRLVVEGVDRVSQTDAQMEATAKRIQAALGAADLTEFSGLLHPDVR